MLFAEFDYTYSTPEILFWLFGVPLIILVVFFLIPWGDSYPPDDKRK